MGSVASLTIHLSFPQEQSLIILLTLLLSHWCPEEGYIHCERSNNRLLISLPSSFPTAWDGSSETDSDHSRRLPPGPEGHEDRIRLSQMVELPTAVRERPVFFGIKPSFLPLASITTLLLYKTSTRVKVCVRNHMTPAIHVMCKTCA